MRFGFGGGFSLRGRKPPAWYVVAGVIAGAFIVGIGIGFLTGMVPILIDVFRSDPEVTATPSPSAESSDSPEIPVDLYPPISRPLDSADTDAGLISLEIPDSATGSLIIVPGSDAEAESGITTWVRIEIEDGLPVVDETLSDFLFAALNDYRGWGAEDRRTFARTEGVADIRIVFASPETALDICERPHEARMLDVEPSNVTVPSPSPSSAVSPSATPEASPSPSENPILPPSCAEMGVVVISAYDWAAGLRGFEVEPEDPEQPDLEVEKAGRTDSRLWLLNHYVGHILGEEDRECEGPADASAGVMADHTVSVGICVPSPWPFPDAEPPPEPTISESPA